MDYHGTYQHPDPPRNTAWCFYCGKLSPWFLCECAEAGEARAGKRQKPRHRRIGDRNVMILEPALLDRPWNSARLPVHRLAHDGAAVNSEQPSVNTEEPVHAEPVNAAEARKAYRREWMRKRRAKS